MLHLCCRHVKPLLVDCSPLLANVTEMLEDILHLCCKYVEPARHLGLRLSAKSLQHIGQLTPAPQRDT